MACVCGKNRFMKPTLIIFGRYPVPGKVKTRLAAGLGPAGAAEVQRLLTERTIAVALKARRRKAFRIEFHTTGGSSRQWKRWLKKFPLCFRPQAEGDLGQRINQAIQTVFEQSGGPVVLVGSDTADLHPEHIQAAFDGLEQHPAVIGPSTDGGYFMIGLQRPVDIFSEIAWSTSRVLAQTRQRLKNLGLLHILLAPATDVDTVDVARTMLPSLSGRPYISVIIPALNEEATIEKAIESARSQDTEIIVADGGSRDRTAALARARGVQVVAGPQGRARQMNLAAARARGQVLLFLHADTCLPPGFVEQVFEALMDPEVILGAFTFRTDAGNWAMKFIEKAANLRSKLGLPYGDQAFFLPRTDFFRLGRFARVTLAEDLLFAKKAGSRGRLVHLPAAAVTSARRWRKKGLVKTTLANCLVAAACLAGICPDRLTKLYFQRNRSIP